MVVESLRWRCYYTVAENADIKRASITVNYMIIARVGTPEGAAFVGPSAGFSMSFFFHCQYLCARNNFQDTTCCIPFPAIKWSKLLPSQMY